jgi:hypothetical protein
LLSVFDFYENRGSESHIIHEILPAILFSGLSEISVLSAHYAAQETTGMWEAVLSLWA